VGQQTLECLLKYQPIIGSLIVVIGWVVMFLYSASQIKKTHKNNLEAQNTLFRQEIEYKAYCKIQEALDQYSSALTAFDGYLRNLDLHLSMLEKGKVLKKDWANIPYELREVNSQQSDTFIEFLRSYESNEIIILEFSSLKNELAKENSFVRETFAELHKIYLEKIDNFPDGIPPIKNIKEVTNKIKILLEKTMDIVGYIYDFRIEMQNRILGPILKKSVQKRQPGDKSVKVLSLDKS
jgi:hypothetical protein